MSTNLSDALSAGGAITLTMRTALELHDQGELANAASLYREVLGMDSHNAEALFLLGLIADVEGEHPVALEMFRTAVSHRPKAVPMRRALAEAWLRAGRPAAAFEGYWQVLVLQPTDALSYVHVADMLMLLKPGGGNAPAAKACYQRALLVQPACSAAHMGMGEIYFLGGDLEAAENAYRAAGDADRHDAGAHAALAEVLFAQQRYSAAADAWRKALRLRPRCVAWLERLGDTLGELGQTIRAEACYQRATELKSMEERSTGTPVLSSTASGYGKGCSGKMPVQ